MLKSNVAVNNIFFITMHKFGLFVNQAMALLIRYTYAVQLLYYGSYVNYSALQNNRPVIPDKQAGMSCPKFRLKLA